MLVALMIPRVFTRYGAPLAIWAAVLSSFSLSMPVEPQPTLTTLLSFDFDNGMLAGAVVYDRATKKLYGTASTGGANDSGTIYRLDPVTADHTTLADFAFHNGFQPSSPIIIDEHGNLFVTGLIGGAEGGGTLSKYDASSGALTALASFNFANGFEPRGRLVFDGYGNVVGVTMEGGVANHGAGTIFRVDLQSGAITTLAAFDSTNGRFPIGGLTADGEGNLYGTASAGGALGHGTIFRLDADTNELTVLANFNGMNGRKPYSDLTLDGGYLYGTTSAGGSSDLGTVFRVDVASGEITTLASFNGTNGEKPSAGVLRDANGNLFGTAVEGGAFDKGVVFRLRNVVGSELETLFSFDGANGSMPWEKLAVDEVGNLYGSTMLGGASPYGGGTVFKLANSGYVVPEPTAAALIAFGMAGLWRRRSKVSGA
jgi:uncharacterized repeat protein (TIGR03803 family)